MELPMHIKQEEVDGEMLSPQILAAKSRYQEDEENCNSHMLIPQEEVDNDYVHASNESLIPKDEDTFYEMSVGKEEVQDESSSDAEFISVKINQKSTQGNRASPFENMTISDHREMIKDKGVKPETNIILLCPFCGLEFPNSLEWRQHVNGVHEFINQENLNMEYVNDTTVKCKDCSAEVSSLSTWCLQLHRIKHLPHNHYFKCKICTVLCARIEMITQHLRTAHNYYVPYEEDVSIVVKTGHNNPDVLCPFCGTKFSGFSQWRDHVNSIHDFKNISTLNMENLYGIKVKCKECQTLISNKLSYIQLHRITHLPHKRYIVCKLCKQRFSSRGGHKRHYQKVHNSTAMISPLDSSLLCPYCGEEHSNMSEWRKHVNDIHEFHKRENLNMEKVSETKAKCKECSAEICSKTKWGLQSHKITHLPYSLWVKCRLCNKKSSCVEIQRRHMIQRHTQRSSL